MKKLLDPKISAVIITKNADKYLKKCLENLGWCEEIIAVDSFSTDKTIDILKKYHVKIFYQKTTSFGKQKNFAISKARNNWVLSIDADEIVSKELQDEIFKSDFNKFNGFYLPRKNHFVGKWIRGCGWYPDLQLRLFRKDKMKFEDKPVHERVISKNKIGYLKNSLIHYTYSSKKEYFIKLERYTSYDAEILFKKNRKWSIIYQFFKPIKEFWKKFILEKGYIDSWLGFKISLYSAYYRWQVAKKLRELYENRN